MDKVWEATRLVGVIYAIAAVVSFLVTLIIVATFAVVRMKSSSESAPAPSRAKASPEAAKADSNKGA